MFFDARLHKQHMFDYFPFNFYLYFVVFTKRFSLRKKITQYFLPEAKRNIQLWKKDLDVPSVPLESPISWETWGNLLIVTLNKV